MWSRKKDEELPPPKPAAAPPPTSSELAREGIPMSTMPVRNFEPESSRGSATIGKSVVVKGEILSREDLVVDGEVEGTVEAQEHRVTIGPNGKLAASVKAREIVVLGTIHGNVEATDKIDIRKDAKLVGDIRTARIVIEDGAYFKGSIDIVRPEVTKQAPAPVAQKAQATAATSQPSSPTQQPLSAGAADGKR